MAEKAAWLGIADDCAQVHSLHLRLGERMIMSITDPSIVDALGVDKQTSEVVLTISDHLDWVDERSHIAALEIKINAYLDFIESGQLSESLADGADRQVKISLIHQSQPPDRIIQILERLKADLAQGRIVFEFHCLPHGY